MPIEKSTSPARLTEPRLTEKDYTPSRSIEKLHEEWNSAVSQVKLLINGKDSNGIASKLPIEPEWQIKVPDANIIKPPLPMSRNKPMVRVKSVFHLVKASKHKHKVRE